MSRACVRIMARHYHGRRSLADDPQSAQQQGIRPPALEIFLFPTPRPNELLVQLHAHYRPRRPRAQPGIGRGHYRSRDPGPQTGPPIRRNSSGIAWSVARSPLSTTPGCRSVFVRPGRSGVSPPCVTRTSWPGQKQELHRALGLADRAAFRRKAALKWLLDDSTTFPTTASCRSRGRLSGGRPVSFGRA